VGHREYVGGLWDEMGRHQFQFLISNGLQPRHYLCDIGCGSLRGGVHFIEYLDPGHYLGIDKEPVLIEKGIEEELGADLYRRKEPKFVISSTFDFSAFQNRADFALAQSLFTHLPPAYISQCFAALREWIAPGGVFYATFFETAVEHANRTKPHDHAGFAYTRAQMESFGANSRWVSQYIGQWDHPRGQVMVRYHAC
jgi:SAM-dependent methyltransferase